jgi:hypothetical protein
VRQHQPPHSRAAHSDGKHLRTIDSQGSSNGQFSSPFGFAFGLHSFVLAALNIEFRSAPMMLTRFCAPNLSPDRVMSAVAAIQRLLRSCDCDYDARVLSHHE